MAEFGNEKYLGALIPVIFCSVLDAPGWFSVRVASCVKVNSGTCDIHRGAPRSAAALPK